LGWGKEDDVNEDEDVSINVNAELSKKGEKEDVDNVYKSQCMFVYMYVCTYVCTMYIVVGELQKCVRIHKRPKVEEREAMSARVSKTFLLPQQSRKKLNYF